MAVTRQTITIQDVKKVEIHEPAKVRTGDYVRHIWITHSTGTFVMALTAQTEGQLRAIPVMNKGGGKSV